MSTFASPSASAVGLPCLAGELRSDDPGGPAFAEGAIAHDPQTGRAVAIDGRLDNRAELSAQLPDHLRLELDGSQTADAKLLLACHLASGPAMLDRLVGDYALALWDPADRRLLLARDPLGTRSLFYCASPHRLIFASALERLLDHPDVPRDHNERALLSYLYGVGYPSGETVYRSVQIVPAGHFLEVTPGSTRLQRFWHWPEAPPEDGLGLNEAAEEFRSLFEQAVLARLPAGQLAGVLLSGGLDSSSVAATSGHLLASESGAVRAYSFVFDEVEECDERRYAQEVAHMHGIPWTPLPNDDCSLLGALWDDGLPPCEPFLGPFDALFLRALEVARDDGASVMLTGNGGDLLVGGSARYLAGWLLSGRLAAVQEEVRAHPRLTRALVGNAFAPLLPVAAQRLVWRERPPGSDWRPREKASRSVARHAKVRGAGRHAWWYELRDTVALVADSRTNPVLDRIGRTFGVELRHPFLDVRLVQLVLRTSPEALYGRGTTKVVLREALRDLLPAGVRGRRDKTVLSPLMQRELRDRHRAYVTVLLDDSELERRGFVRTGAWKRAVRSQLDGSSSPYISVWLSLTLEVWLRREAGRLPPLEPCRGW